jgi:hypothetical protein
MNFPNYVNFLILIIHTYFLAKLNSKSSDTHPTSQYILLVLPNSRSSNILSYGSQIDVLRPGMAQPCIRAFKS